MAMTEKQRADFFRGIDPTLQGVPDDREVLRRAADVMQQRAREKMAQGAPPEVERALVGAATGDTDEEEFKPAAESRGWWQNPATTFAKSALSSAALGLPEYIPGYFGENERDENRKAAMLGDVTGMFGGLGKLKLLGRAAQLATKAGTASKFLTGANKVLGTNKKMLAAGALDQALAGIPRTGTSLRDERTALDPKVREGARDAAPAYAADFAANAAYGVVPGAPATAGRLTKAAIRMGMPAAVEATRSSVAGRKDEDPATEALYAALMGGAMGYGFEKGEQWISKGARKLLGNRLPATGTPPPPAATTTSAPPATGTAAAPPASATPGNTPGAPLFIRVRTAPPPSPAQAAAAAASGTPPPAAGTVVATSSGQPLPPLPEGEDYMNRTFARLGMQEGGRRLNRLAKRQRTISRAQEELNDDPTPNPSIPWTYRVGDREYGVNNIVRGHIRLMDGKGGSTLQRIHANGRLLLKNMFAPKAQGEVDRALVLQGEDLLEMSGGVWPQDGIKHLGPDAVAYAIKDGKGLVSTRANPKLRILTPAELAAEGNPESERAAAELQSWIENFQSNKATKDVVLSVGDADNIDASMQTEDELKRSLQRSLDALAGTAQARGGDTGLVHLKHVITPGRVGPTATPPPASGNGRPHSGGGAPAGSPPPPSGGNGSGRSGGSGRRTAPPRTPAPPREPIPNGGLYAAGTISDPNLSDEQMAAEIRASMEARAARRRGGGSAPPPAGGAPPAAPTPPAGPSTPPPAAGGSGKGTPLPGTGTGSGKGKRGRKPPAPPGSTPLPKGEAEAPAATPAAGAEGAPSTRPLDVGTVIVADGVRTKLRGEAVAKFGQRLAESLNTAPQPGEKQSAFLERVLEDIDRQYPDRTETVADNIVRGLAAYYRAVNKP